MSTIARTPADFRVVFRGMWHGYNTMNGVHTLQAEEYADIMVEDAGNSVHSQAGCRSQWFTYATAAKLGSALLASAIAGIKRTQDTHVFVLTPNRKTLKEVVLNGEQTVSFRNDSIVVNGKQRSLKVWKLSVRKNPDLEEATKEITHQRALLASAITALVKAAYDSSNPQLKESARRLYEEAQPVLSLDPEIQPAVAERPPE